MVILSSSDFVMVIGDIPQTLTPEPENNIRNFNTQVQTLTHAHVKSFDQKFNIPVVVQAS